MRIGIDARTLLGPRTGIGRYSYNVVPNLLAIDPHNKYVLFVDRKSSLSFPSSSYDKRIVGPLNFGRASMRKVFSPLWTNFFLPRALKREGIDLLFCPNFVSPLKKVCETIIVIHDLAAILFPGVHDKIYSFYLRNMLSVTCRKIDRIITVSEASKRDVIRLFKVPENRIRVIYSAVEDIFRPVDDPEMIKRIVRKYGLVKNFILYVGTLERRKNVTSLIKAYGKLRKNKQISRQLAVVGKKGWRYPDIAKAIRNSDFERDILLAGYVPDEDLVYIYNAADLFVYPSLYEGFGFPPLEAMACGTPVITSHVTALPEVVGDAAILVDPEDIDGLAEAMHDVLSQNSLRLKLIEKGLERVKHFSWENVAKKTLSVYNRVYKGTRD